MDISEVASRILKNRLSGTTSQSSQIPLTGKCPYSIQKEVAKSAENIRAWKAGGTNEKTQKYFDTTEAYFGPIPTNVILSNKKISLSKQSLLSPLKGEVEICFSLNELFNHLADDFRLVDLISTIDTVHLGLEMPWTQFVQPESGLDYLIADLCGANALLVGDGVKFSIWEGMSDDTLRLESGEQTVTSGNVQDSIIKPLETLNKFAQFCNAQQIVIQNGSFLATGGVTQCVALNTGIPITVSSKHLPSLNILIV